MHCKNEYLKRTNIFAFEFVLRVIKIIAGKPFRSQLNNSVEMKMEIFRSDENVSPQLIEEQKAIRILRDMYTNFPYEPSPTISGEIFLFLLLTRVPCH